MKRLLILLMFVNLAYNVNALENVNGLHCGPRGNLWGTIASDYFIPDYFPPENTLLRMILVNPFLIDLSVCEENFTPVHLGASCFYHDRCYGTLGETKDGCDISLLLGWLQSCNEQYLLSSETSTSNMCLNACESVVNLMYNAMRYDDGNFCPSCIAFEEAQKNARGGKVQ